MSRTRALLTGLGFALSLATARAQDVSDLDPLPVTDGEDGRADSLRDGWDSFEQKLRLRPREERALELASELHEARDAPDPVRGDEGSVVFRFGSPPMPTVICATLRVCDIELEPGEVVREAPLSGGAEEWSIHPMRSGSPVETTHIVVKPLRSGVVTNLIVPTDRRTYHIELRATRKEHDPYMPRVAFVYPSEQRAKWQEYLKVSKSRPALAAASASPLAPTAMRPSPVVEDNTRVDVSKMHTAYEVIKRGRWLVRRRIEWAPVRVWDNGTKTIIEMPPEAARRELPILLVCDDRDEDCNGDGDGRIVNFRVKDTRFIVDRIFRAAVLVKGVGGQQERVSIRRLKGE